MEIQEVIKIVNQMQADGVIEEYAVGGAVGATFYLEPVATLDVDIFLAIHAQAGSLIVSLQTVFDYLKARGGVMEGEYMVIAGTPVQFLLPPTALVEEALRRAVQKEVDGASVPVFTAEHLAAIALETGRAKDKTRLVQFIEEEALDLEAFQEILRRHGLWEKWERFQRQFLSEQ